MTFVAAVGAQVQTAGLGRRLSAFQRQMMSHQHQSQSELPQTSGIQDYGIVFRITFVFMAFECTNVML